MRQMYRSSSVPLASLTLAGKHAEDSIYSLYAHAISSAIDITTTTESYRCFK